MMTGFADFVPKVSTCQIDSFDMLDSAEVSRASIYGLTPCSEPFVRSCFEAWMLGCRRCQIDRLTGSVSDLIKMFDRQAGHAGGGRSFPALHAPHCRIGRHPSGLDTLLTGVRLVRNCGLVLL